MSEAYRCHGRVEGFSHCYRNSHTSVATQLSSQRKEQIIRNKHYLASIVEVLLLCATSEIALRGHREVDLLRKGNFLRILDLIGMQT